MRSLLFPKKSYDSGVSLGLLVLRVVFGGLLLWFCANDLVSGFSLRTLVTLIEIVCAAGLVLGLLHRIVLIPLLIIAAVTCFCVSEVCLPGACCVTKETTWMFFAAFAALFLSGSGKWSLDRMLF